MFEVWSGRKSARAVHEVGRCCSVGRDRSMKATLRVATESFGHGECEQDDMQVCLHSRVAALRRPLLQAVL